MIRAFNDTGAEEKAFNVVATIKFDCKGYEFVNGEGCARNIIGFAINTVSTIINAVVRKEGFEEGNTAAIFRKTMTNSPTIGAANGTWPVFAGSATGSAGDVIFSRFCEDLKFLNDRIFHGMHMWIVIY